MQENESLSINFVIFFLFSDCTFVHPDHGTVGNFTYDIEKFVRQTEFPIVFNRYVRLKPFFLIHRFFGFPKLYIQWKKNWFGIDQNLELSLFQIIKRKWKLTALALIQCSRNLRSIYTCHHLSFPHLFHNISVGHRHYCIVLLQYALPKFEPLWKLSANLK